MAGFEKAQVRGSHGRWAGSKTKLLAAARKALHAQAEARKAVQLSRSNAAAISHYTHDSYAINRGLWRDKGTHVDVVKQINNALDRFPNHVGTVFRNVDMSRQSSRDRYEVGNTVTEKGFISTTTKRDTGFGGDFKFVIHSKTGKQIWGHSNHPEEREVMFKSGTKFKVMAKHVAKNGITVIYLREK